MGYLDFRYTCSQKKAFVILDSSNLGFFPFFYDIAKIIVTNIFFFAKTAALTGDLSKNC
jgi:hypothetical protein